MHEGVPVKDYCTAHAECREELETLNTADNSNNTELGAGINKGYYMTMGMMIQMHTSRTLLT